MVDKLSEGPRPPRLPSIRLSALEAVGEAEVLDGDADLDGVELTGVRSEGLVWEGRRRLSSARMCDLTVTDWNAWGMSLVECSLEQLDVVSMAAADSRWRAVEVRQSRIGSAELYDAVWDGVHFVGCKLGFLNLRGARLTDVAFTDCVIDGLDLMRATASRVAFQGSRIARLDSSGARLVEVDLRGARLGELGSVEGLRGASITLEQLLDLAPVMAARLGIRVD